MSKTYILNTPVLTNYGVFRFRQIDVEGANEILQDGFISAVGHQGTAEVLTALLGVEIHLNRQQIEMLPGDSAIVFRLLKRMPEGVVLSKEELLALPYEIGLLERIA